MYVQLEQQSSYFLRQELDMREHFSSLLTVPLNAEPFYLHTCPLSISEQMVRF